MSHTNAHLLRPNHLLQKPHIFRQWGVWCVRYGRENTPDEKERNNKAAEFIRARRDGALITRGIESRSWRG